MSEPNYIGSWAVKDQRGKTARVCPAGKRQIAQRTCCAASGNTCMMLDSLIGLMHVHRRKIICDICENWSVLLLVFETDQGR